MIFQAQHGFKFLMESDILIAQTTVDIVEEILGAVCEKSNSASHPYSGQNQQPSSLLTTSQPASLSTFQEREQPFTFLTYFDFANEEKAQKTDQHVMSPQAETPWRNNKVVKSCNLNRFLVCGTTETPENDQYSLIPKSFQSENNPFDECNDMIKKSLDTFDTDVNKENCVQLPDTLKPLSDSTQNHKPEVYFQPSGLSNSHLSALGITDHCLKTMKINDQRYSRDSFSNESTVNLTDSESLIDDEIDRMVKEIISNNVELLSSAVSLQKYRNRKHPSLYKRLKKLPGKNPSNSMTPECSNNFAELKLNAKKPNSLLDFEFNPNPTSLPRRSVPSAWLNSKRNQRSTATNLSKSRSRSHDFVYCGPLREKKKQDGEDRSC